MTTQIVSPIDIPTILQIPIENPLPADLTTAILSSPPFIPLPGALNLRTISHSPHLGPNLIYRSAALGHLPASSQAQLLTTHNIKTIFDLRSAPERDRAPAPVIPGIETRFIPVSTEAGIPEGLKHVTPADFVEDGGRKGYEKMYERMLELYKDAFREVLMCLKDLKAEDGGVLFHCTAGKDRTGILAALILALAGASKPAISQDYALTRIGIEPAREKLMAILLAQMGCTIEEPGLQEMCTIRAETMEEFLEMVERRWGGIEGYLVQELGMSQHDLKAVRGSLKR